ncbi:unnamed protein product [Cuscuta epithymum]|uniref:Cystatin domain-containing protein n=1 Tax=Cuscuta epithymum TaxID=186058 RepID=A0AAV0G9N5_9ASTE|nr:unnamed protein product [Cuscuta epithymum]
MAAIDGGSLELGVSTPFYPPPEEKPKTETDVGSDCVSNKVADVFYIAGRRFRRAYLKDEEFQRQSLLFEDQFVRSEGFEIDWDQFDYLFNSHNLAWAGPLYDDMTNEELVQSLIRQAIEEHNEENGTNLEFVRQVKTNFWNCAGYLFWITFEARDLSSNNPDTKLYQTKVWKFNDEVEVSLFRERPTDEEIASVHVEIPEYECFKLARYCFLFHEY